MLERTSVPPCFSVMPMPSVMPRLVQPWREGRIVGTRGDHGHHLRQQVRLHRQRRDRRARHRDRAEMPSLDLRGHVKFCRAHHLRRAAGRPALRVPGRIMHAGMRGVRHQLVIGRMKLDLVAAVAAGIEGAQFWCVLVGNASALGHRGGAPMLAEFGSSFSAAMPPLAATASSSGRSTDRDRRPRRAATG